MALKEAKYPYKDLEDFIYNYPTKNEVGFILEEQKDVIKILKEKNISFNEDKYWNAQIGITCQMSESGLVIYHCDVYKSALCGLENRDLNIEEWD